MTEYIQDNNHLINKLLAIRNNGDHKRVQKPSLHCWKMQFTITTVNIEFYIWWKKFFKNEDEINILLHEGKLKECITNRPALPKRMLKTAVLDRGKWFRMETQILQKKSVRNENIWVNTKTIFFTFPPLNFFATYMRV